jgi:radical SAM protein with 4Fe4S-binding SPASM domain
MREAVLLLKNFSFRKAYNSLCLRFAYLLKLIFRNVKNKCLPEALSIEISSVCNLKCPQCPTGLGKIKRKNKFIDKELYVGVLDDVSPTLWHLFLYFQGEPLMNSDFAYYIKEAKKRKIYVAISTNGHYLTENACNQLVDSGLDEVIISLDGTSQDEYAKYRVGGNFDKVLKGIRTLVETKNRKNSKRPIVTLQFIVFSHNEKSIDEFKILARHLSADKIQIKTAQLENLRDVYLLPENEKYRRYRIENGKAVIKKKLKNRCWRMWHSSVITTDGVVVPCCFDKYSENEMGNINHNDFREIWHSSKYDEFRNKVFTNRKSIKMCRNCTE